MPSIGKEYEYTDHRGRRYRGRVTKIARVRTGAVLAFLDSGKAFPVTKHGIWREVK